MICLRPVSRGCGSGGLPQPGIATIGWGCGRHLTVSASDDAGSVVATRTSGPTPPPRENFGSYKLLIADVVGGQLEAMPRGVIAAAAVMQGLQDPDQASGGGESAVVFQVELALEGVEDRLEGLAEWFEQACTGPVGFGPCGGGGTARGRRRRGRLRRRGRSSSCPRSGSVRGGWRAGCARRGAGRAGPATHRSWRRSTRSRWATRARWRSGAGAVPEEAGVTGAVAVLCPAGQRRAADGVTGAGTFRRGGVHHPHVVGEHAGVAGQQRDQPVQGAASLRSR